MIKVAGYCRVSTDKDQAHSFASQKQYFRKYIEAHPGWELHEIYADEGITGTSTKRRTQFNRMISDACEGKFSLIITKEVSRFSRNILDTIRYTRELKAIGIGVIFSNDRINTLEPEAEMLLSFLASLAQEESRRTSSRVVWGQTRQMEKGVVFGQSLLGYDVKDGVLTIDPEGAKIVELIFQKYAVEQFSTAEIARHLNSKGYSTYRRSGGWKPNGIIKILKNEKYVGDLVQKKTYTPDYLSHEKRRNKGEVPLIVIKDHHEPIISREVWEMAQERLRKNNKHGGENTGHSNRYVFSGKIRCGECGRGFVGRVKYRKDGTMVRRWSCAAAARGGREACDVGKLLRDDDAIQMLKAAIQSLPVDFESLIETVTELALDAIQREKGTEDPRRLELEMERVQQKKEAAMDSYFSGEITKEDMLAMHQKYAGQLERLRRRQEAECLGRERQDPAAIRAVVAGILKGEIESEVFYKTMLESLTVFKDRHMELRLCELPQIVNFLG